MATVAIGAVLLSVDTDIALYVHLSSVMNARFDTVERRLDRIQSETHQLDLRLAKIKSRT